MFIKKFWYRIVFWTLSWVIKAKWFILGGYYDRLIVHAAYLYTRSELFKIRWQELGFDYANESFKDVGEYFFHKAQREPFVIRWQIFKDFMAGRPAQAYYLPDDHSDV